MTDIHRIAEYRAQSLAYLRQIKQIEAHFAANPEGTVKLSWAGPRLTRDQWKREFMELLDYRITICGGGYREPRDGEAVLLRDQRAAREFCAPKRIRHYGLESRLARKRLAQVDHDMRALRNEERLDPGYEPTGFSYAAKQAHE